MIPHTELTLTVVLALKEMPMIAIEGWNRLGKRHFPLSHLVSNERITKFKYSSYWTLENSKRLPYCIPLSHEKGGANILRVKSLPDRKYSFVAFVLILLAFGTRIAYLSAPSLWLDEAISANIARSPLTSCIQFAKGDLHPPLYYLLIHLWSLIGHDEFTLRLFSVISNFLSGVILFICVRQMFNPSIALLTLIFFAISPFQIRYSQEVRMYSLLGLWIVLVLFSVLQYLKSKSWGSLSCYIISASLGLYTHYQAVIFLTLINIAVFIRLFRTGKGNLWQWILAQLAILALFSPWLPTFINQFKGGGRSWVPFLPSFPLFISPLFAFLWGEPILSKVYHSLWPFFLRLRELGSIIPWFEKLSLSDYLYFHYPDDLDGQKETHAAKLADSFHKLPPHRNPRSVLWFII